METKHIIPVGGPKPLHVASGSCWCHPAPDTEAPGILVHNAKDCREKWERQGLRPENDSAWVTIIEAAQVPTAAEILTRDHPEANGRKPKPGEQEFVFSFIAEDGHRFNVRMGAEGWRHHSQHVLDMLTEAPSYDDGSLNGPSPDA